MSDSRALMRKKLLEDIYNDLSDEDKRIFVRLTMEDRNYRDIMEAIQSQDRKLDDIRKSQSWWLDFGANIAGNVFTDGVWLIGRKLLGKV